MQWLAADNASFCSFSCSCRSPCSTASVLHFRLVTPRRLEHAQPLSHNFVTKKPLPTVLSSAPFYCTTPPSITRTSAKRTTTTTVVLPVDPNSTPTLQAKLSLRVPPRCSPQAKHLPNPRPVLVTTALSAFQVTHLILLSASLNFPCTAPSQVRSPSSPVNMDSSDANNGSRTALRQPFIDTANALASLYKKAVSAERDARDAGSRAAYMQIMQWAARKSHAGERISPAEIINFCTGELAEIQANLPVSAPATVDRALHSQSVSAPRQTQQQLVTQVSRQSQGPPDLQGKGDADGPGNGVLLPSTQFQPQQQVQTVAYVARDDPLVSDIKKLHVNPRKRQRVDISDNFLSACRDNDNLIFSSGNSYAIHSPDSSMSPMFLETDPAAHQGSSPSPRRESKDSRDTPFISANSNEYAARKGKNAKVHIYDKVRRK